MFLRLRITPGWSVITRRQRGWHHQGRGAASG